jgi:hypothetical protein
MYAQVSQVVRMYMLIYMHINFNTRVHAYACVNIDAHVAQRRGGELPMGARASTSRPKEHTKTAALGYGLQGETIYSTEYKRPQTSKGFVPNKIVSKTEIEGTGPHEVEPYGPLCKSLMQESYPAPPPESYLKRPKTYVPMARSTTVMHMHGTLFVHMNECVAHLRKILHFILPQFGAFAGVKPREVHRAWKHLGWVKLA